MIASPHNDQECLVPATERVIAEVEARHPALVELAMPAFAETPAARQKRLIAMDGLYLLGFGPRTPAAARDLMAAIYPEASIPPLKTAQAQ